MPTTTGEIKIGSTEISSGSPIFSAGTTSKKRSRGSMESVQAEIMTREADPETALEVDVMLLDYQAYYTTRMLLRDVGGVGLPHETIKSSMLASDALHYTFRKKHTSYVIDCDLRFRLLLLQFSTLFCRRYYADCAPHEDDLEALRRENRARATRWIGNVSRLPSSNYETGPLETMPGISFEQLASHKKHVLEDCQVDLATDLCYGYPGSISLLDLLPKFMHLCASSYQKTGIKLLGTMRLMTEFMIQAVLEQYLVYGACDTVDPIDEAFAWGCFEDPTSAETDELAADPTLASQRVVSHVDDTPAVVAEGHFTDDAQQDQSLAAPEDASLVDTFRTVEQPALAELEHIIDNLFRDAETGKESETWTKAKAFALGQLLEDIAKTDAVSSRLQDVARLCPMRSFHTAMRDFLSQCTQLIDLPVIAQIEHGQLKGLTRAQTSSFLVQCGLRPDSIAPF